MTEAPRTRSNLVWWLVLAAVGAAGLFAGGSFRTWFAPRTDGVAPPMPLHAGTPLPDVPLVAPDGTPARSSAIVGPSGGLVLMLDPACSPCERMAVEWESRRQAGAPAAAGLVAVAEGPSDVAGQFARRFGLGYPVYADTGHRLRAAGVNHLPIAVWVDGGGNVSFATFDVRDDAPRPAR